MLAFEFKLFTFENTTTARDVCICFDVACFFPTAAWTFYIVCSEQVGCLFVIVCICFRWFSCFNVNVCVLVAHYTCI